MAKKEITLSTGEWAAAGTAKQRAADQLRVDELYNLAVDTINVGEYKFEITNEQLDLFQEVDALLRTKGFRLLRGLNSFQAYIDLAPARRPFAGERSHYYCERDPFNHQSPKGD